MDQPLPSTAGSVASPLAASIPGAPPVAPPGAPPVAPPSGPLGAPGRALRIGIDARAACEVPAGRGRVVRELLRALAAREDRAAGWDRELGGDRAGGGDRELGWDRELGGDRDATGDGRLGHRYLLYARQEWGAGELDDERFQWRLLDARDPWWHLRAARLANRECDVFLSSNSYLTARFLRIPTVPIVYDLATFESSMRPNRRSRLIERLTLGTAVKRSSAFLAISQATAEALISRYPEAASRTVVAPLGVSPGLAENGLAGGNGGAGPDAGVGAPPSGTLGLEPDEVARLPAPGFVLAVGTLEPRKNLPRLVAAYATLEPDLQARHPLVVVGALGWDTGGTLDALRSLGDRCEMLGYVSDEALAELYRRCAVFCYPSLGEGFGLPVLEAMAAGAVVLTSNVSSLPEVGGEAVAYADPLKVEEIAGELRSLLGDGERRAELSAAARARAGEFSWAAFADGVLGTLAGAARI